MGPKLAGQMVVPMASTRLKIGGFGGQGVILAGHLIGKAAAIYDKKHSVMTQSFGPEARGSACSSQVIISDTPIRYPYVRRADMLVVMSQEAFDKFEPQLEDEGLLLVEKDLVRCAQLRPGIRTFGVPATRLAEGLGKKMVLNVVMVGFWTAVAGLLDEDAVRRAIRSTVPKGTEELNIAAFEEGYRHGVALTADEVHGD